MSKMDYSILLHFCLEIFFQSKKNTLLFYLSLFAGIVYIFHWASNLNKECMFDGNSAYSMKPENANTSVICQNSALIHHLYTNLYLWSDFKTHMWQNKYWEMKPFVKRSAIVHRSFASNKPKIPWNSTTS